VREFALLFLPPPSISLSLSLSSAESTNGRYASRTPCALYARPAYVPRAYTCIPRARACIAAAIGGWLIEIRIMDEPISGQRDPSCPKREKCFCRCARLRSALRKLVFTLRYGYLATRAAALHASIGGSSGWRATIIRPGDAASPYEYR